MCGPGDEAGDHSTRNFALSVRVVRRMRPLITSFAAMMLVASSAFAGLTYDFTSVSSGMSNGTITGTVKAEGTNIRIDITRGDGVLFENGSFVLSADGGRTMQVVNPAAKTFYVLNLDQIVGSADSLLKTLGGMVKLDIRNPRVTVTGGAAAGTIEGFDTKKSTVTSAYEIAVEGLGQPLSMKMNLHTDVWWTEQLSAEFTNFLQMRGLRTGIEAVDRLIEAERASIKGFPMKQITTAKMSFGGNDMTSTTTSTVTNVKKAAVAASAFALPQGLARTASPLEKILGGR